VQKILVTLLRLCGAGILLALVPVFMPFAWMDTIHRWLGLGELPQTPIVGYLTRSLSALYAIHGALLVFVSFDIRRYLPVVKFLAITGLVSGAGLLWLDWAVGLPRPWVICEGPSVMLVCLVFLGLARRVGCDDRGALLAADH
jgi:hypothetical protein